MKRQVAKTSIKTSKMAIETEWEWAIIERTQPIIDRWGQSGSMNLRGLIRDAYLQGLLDGSSKSVQSEIFGLMASEYM